jgi:hypothetical protein
MDRKQTAGPSVMASHPSINIPTNGGVSHNGPVMGPILARRGGASSVPLTPEQVAAAAEKQDRQSYSTSSCLFGLGLFLFIVGLILLFLIRRCWMWIAYFLIVFGLILLLASALVYCMSAPNKYCMAHPSDESCATRYSA